MNELFQGLNFMLRTSICGEINHLLDLYRQIPDKSSTFMESLQPLILNNSLMETNPQISKTFYYAYRKFILDHFDILMNIDDFTTLTNMVTQLYGLQAQELFNMLYAHILADIQPSVEYSYMGKLVDFFFNKWKTLIYTQYPQVINNQPTRHDILTNLLPDLPIVLKYDYHFGGKLGLILRGHSYLPTHVFSLPRNKIVSVDQTGTMMIWDSKNLLFKVHSQSPFDEVRVFNNSILTTYGETLYVWSSTGILTHQIDTTSHITDIHILNSNHIITLHHDNLEIWNIQEWTRAYTLHDLHDHFTILSSNTFLYVTDNTIKVWDFKTRKYISIFDYINPIIKIIPLPNNLIAIHHNDVSIQIWDVLKGIHLRSIVNQYEFSNLQFIPFTQEICVMSRGGVFFYDYKTAQLTGDVFTGDMTHTAGSLCNGYLVYYNDKHQIQIVDPVARKTDRFFTKVFERLKILADGHLGLIQENHDIYILH